MRFFSLLSQYLIALVLTISAYGIYGKFVSPRIEGESQFVKPTPRIPPGEGRPAVRIKEDLAGFFPADGWEWDPCTILETKRARILFQDHKVLDDGTVELTPLSMVLNSETKIVDGKEVQAPPIILRAPHGARLKFERPLSAGGDMGDLEHGQLLGEVQIFRPSSRKDKDDSLYVVTQNVQISPERIYTLYDCDFRFGESYGRGKRLTVDLFGPTKDSNNESTTFSGVERIEMARVYELLLHRDKPTQLYAPGQKPQQADLLGDTNRSFRITSDGPMVFDFHAKTVSFQDQVKVQPAQDPIGEGDQLTCHKLTVRFSGPSPTATATDARQNVDMKVQRLIAEGQPDEPAVVTSVTRNAQIIANKIDYDLINNRVTLTSNDRVTINRNNQQISSREIRYGFTDDGRIGDAVMMGPGTMLQPEEKGTAKIVCHWQKKLTLQDDDGKKVLSLDRGRIDMDVTTVQAEQMHLWLWEVPEPTEEGKKQRWRFEPAKMFASGQVTIQSPKLDGTCGEAAAFWPKPDPNAQRQVNVKRRSVPGQVFVARYRPAAQERPATQEQQTETYPVQQASTKGLSWQSQPVTSELSWQNQSPQTGHQSYPVDPVDPVGSAGAVQQAVYWQTDSDQSQIQLASQETSVAQPERKTKFVGNQVQLQMHGGDRRGDVEELTVDGDVVVQQKQRMPGGVEETSLEIRGQKLRVMSQPDERYRLFVSGKGNQVASVLLDDMQMRGNLIHLDQSANRLWIEGPGQMKMAGTSLSANAAPPLQADSRSQSAGLLSSGDTNVTWQGGMVFDGQMIYFETGVVSNSRQTDRQDASITTTASRSAALSITLDQRIDFNKVESEDNVTPKVKATKLVMVGQMDSGEVAFPDFWQPTNDSRVQVAIGKFDQAGQAQSNQEIIADRATFDVKTGTVQCRGPGTVIARQLAKSGAGRPTTQLASTGSGRSGRDGQLDFIKVEFDSNFQGNTETKELIFEGNVHTFYADANQWNSVPAESVLQRPGNHGVIMDCDRLVLAQWTPQDSEPTMEMIATGNSRIKGGQFNANADRISYYQGTGQVVLEAPTRSNSEIWFKRPGQANKGHLVAKTINYNVDSGEYQVQEMKQIEYSQQGPLRGKQ